MILVKPWGREEKPVSRLARLWHEGNESQGEIRIPACNTDPFGLPGRNCEQLNQLDRQVARSINAFLHFLQGCYDVWRIFCRIRAQLY